MWRLSLTLLLLFYGCSAAHPPFCGESFCMVEKPSAVSKTSPVDFNLYRIKYDGRHFLIYEGNAPERGEALGGVGPDLVPPGFVDGELTKTQGRFSLVLRTPNPRFPAYVAISADSNNPLDIQRLASKLRAKQVCRDCP